MSVSSRPQQFLSSEQDSSYDQAQVVIIPIPYEATTTFRKGCENGPQAVLDASDQLEAYDEELRAESCDLGIYTLAPIADTRQGPVADEEMLRVTEETVAKVIADGKFAIAVGGEHSITTGVVRAYKAATAEPFTVVQIDAHGDMRYEFEGSLHNHACVMRRVLEMDLPTLPVAIRAICKEEADLIDEKSIPVVWGRQLRDRQWIAQALASIKTPKVFITIDVDGIDPTLIPGVGTPEPGGLEWYETLEFLRQVFERHEVIGCDVMELAPIADSVVSEFTTAKLIYKLIGYHRQTKQG